MITSPDLLATLCLMQPRISLAFFVARAHCWLPFSWVSTRIPMSFPIKLKTLSQRTIKNLATVSQLFFQQIVKDFIREFKNRNS